jgi:hypothetical protein
MAKLSEAMEETHMEIKNYPEIMKADKRHWKLFNKWEKTTIAFNKAAKDANCYDCESKKYKYIMQAIPFCEDSCKRSEKLKRLLSEYNEDVLRVKEYDKIVYAKVVFDTFAPLKPMLVAILDGGKLMNWDTVFGFIPYN